MLLQKSLLFTFQQRLIRRSERRLSRGEMCLPTRDCNGQGSVPRGVNCKVSNRDKNGKSELAGLENPCLNRVSYEISRGLGKYFRLALTSPPCDGLGVSPPALSSRYNCRVINTLWSIPGLKWVPQPHRLPLLPENQKIPLPPPRNKTHVGGGDGTSFFLQRVQLIFSGDDYHTTRIMFFLY